MMFWEGLTAISAQKHFQIKFINIAIYCNNFFDIAIYRNTFLGPQYPALPLTRRGKTKFAIIKWYNLCLQIIQSQTCYPLNDA